MSVRPSRISVRLSRMSGRGRESLPNVWEGLGVPPGSLGRLTRPSLMSGEDRETLPEV